MKYLLITIAFFLSGAFSDSSQSSDHENCAYATEDIHTVSNSSYERLLARLNQSDTEEEETNRRPRPSRTKGQR